MTRFRHRDGSLVHLAYCTNVHPAEDLEGVLAQLERFADPLRRRLESGRLGVGLWLAAPVARRLRGEADGVARLRDALDRLGLEVVSFNGFPYRAFHAPVVKRAVYHPDWTRPERREYTLDLAWLLAALLPDDVTEGSISTLPCGWRAGWTERHTAAARAALATVAVELERLEQTSGRRVRLAIEPEPGCAIETTAQAIAALDGLDPAWVGICLDACHMAVQFEEPEVVQRALRAAGVPVVKAQASAALRAARPDSTELESFVEPRFLHQTRARTSEGVVGVDDLDDALAGGLPREHEWRVHFHVPVHLDDGRTTQPQLRALLACLLGGSEAATRHVELETYT
ncbi:MAG: metabolite traffic protein EboE, partial [Solirubrobacteraceae bacterium]